MTASRRVSRIVIYAILIVAAAFFLLPVYVLVVTSLKSYAEVNLATMWNPPTGFSLDSSTLYEAEVNCPPWRPSP